jgi:hypothetical protein
VVASLSLVTVTAGSTLLSPVVLAGVDCARACPAHIAISEIATGVSRDWNKRALARRLLRLWSMVVFIVAGKFSA